MAKRRTGNTVTPLDRLWAMRSLRQDGVNDAVISRAFGISRERVAQLIGRNRATQTYQKKNKEKTRILLAMAKDGKSAKEISESIGGTQSMVFQALKALGHHYSDFHEQRLKKRRERIMEEVIGFLQKHDVPLTISSLLRHDRSLWGRMDRNGHIQEWRDEVTKEVKKRGLDLKIREPYSKP